MFQTNFIKLCYKIHNNNKNLTDCPCALWMVMTELPTRVSQHLIEWSPEPDTARPLAASNCMQITAALWPLKNSDKDRSTNKPNFSHQNEKSQIFRNWKGQNNILKYSLTKDIIFSLQSPNTLPTAERPQLHSHVVGAAQEKVFVHLKT